MLYDVGTLFGRATDDPQSLAKTVLGVMISYMFGGPTFISKMFAYCKIEFAISLWTCIESCYLQWQQE